MENESYLRRPPHLLGTPRGAGATIVQVQHPTRGIRNVIRLQVQIRTAHPRVAWPSCTILNDWEERKNNKQKLKNR